MDPSAASAGASRRKAEQWLSVAEKLLVARDLEGCKQFASQALAADPHTPGADDLHAAAAALLAAQRRRLPNGQPDPYAVLGLDPANAASRHPDAIHSHYRRLSFVLNHSHPNRPCSLAFADAARLVANAWAFLSDPVLKSALDAELDAAAAAAAARVYHSPVPNRPQPQSQSPLPPRPTPPSVAPSPRPTPPPAAPSPRPTPRPVAPQIRSPPPPAAPPPRPTPQPVAPQIRPTPPPVATPPLPTSPPVAHETRPTPPPAAPQTPAAATTPRVDSGAPPPLTFWTVCTACCHIHQYDRLYETCKLLCPSCRQPFVAEAMADPPPIVPGTDMYYCTWGFFPVGFPGCPGFERMVNSPPPGPDQLNAPWLAGTGGAKRNARDNADNGVPVTAAAEVPVEVPSATPPVKPMRMKMGAKKRGRPKGSKNKNKL
ncbi:formin-like protein 20 [Phragmites australis]|uniref:formin-like protein 20 n=1 Tax=Phragmites australis TaxID=29695 RepID=UPI002D782E5C|nr:formin-like protein 20 [Phragmites australis]